MSEIISNNTQQTIESTLSFERKTILVILEDLKDSVSKRNTTIPATENLYLKVDSDKNHVVFIATNLRITVKKIIHDGVEIQGSGAFTIEPSLLYQTIKSITTESNVLFEIGENRVWLKIGRNKFQFVKGDSKNFPEFPAMESNKLNRIAMPLPRLKEIMKSANAALGEEAIENAFSGVKLELQEDGILFASTDRHRLYYLFEKSSDLNEKEHDDEVILPKHFIDLIMKASHAIDVEMSYCPSDEGNHIMFEYGGNIAMIRQVSGVYPPINKFAEQQLHNDFFSVDIGKGVLKDTLSIVSKYSNQGEADLIFKVNEHNIKIQSITTYDNAGVMYLPYEGEVDDRFDDWKVRLNIKYLLGIIMSSPASIFRLNIPNVHNKAIVISPLYDEENTIESITKEMFFLMPLNHIDS